MGIKSGVLSIKAGINLSQLEYAAEILPPRVWKESEALQIHFCRRGLRCSSMNCKLAMQGELGGYGLCKQDGYEVVKLKIVQCKNC
jgi:hypothetical protein